MSTAIPKSILHEIQKFQRGFIWGDDIDGRKYHAVSWNVVSQLKSLGGLGLRRLTVMNTACLMKLGWDLRCGSFGWSSMTKL